MFVRLVEQLFGGCHQTNFTQRYGDALVVGTREPKDVKRNGGGRSVVDREKVIKGLECCILRDPDDKMRCSECPYNEPDTYCLNRLKMDAFALIGTKPRVMTLGEIMECGDAEIMYLETGFTEKILNQLYFSQRIRRKDISVS